ncbi:tRNA/rRNA methyltransferase [Mixta intestinalis]|uniref:23S rRNA (Guanosine-2'-O-)-methyltransferase RlmB n=1 Tax=Mixta intestinalis TaxID=1615494 RepID=A0A6P1Q251_9GAMM|nr:tRNA/rRNA methyltransferase [Mixta intestinalis]QHM72169.1 23S rRNA (guanosine-2'-O-)-methyltransferase RlmB [Mixta intestinalis]
MNDEFKGKSGKVKVMYVRGDDNGDKRGQNPRTGRGSRPGADRQEGSRRPSRQSDSAARGGRDGKFRGNRDRDAQPRSDSPWRTVSRAPGEETKPDHGGISGKSYIDPEQLRRQRMEETRVYGENACQALFQSRPECIVRAWFVQSVTPRFRDALRWLAANRKAYHVVEEAELEKASGTEHHGGVCFLIKKRVGTPVSEWLATDREQDCVLALENIGNPHNIGGIMRSSAHFGVKGLLVDDAAVLESGAAVRTAEGGAEHVQALSAESFVKGLEAFRKAGYTIVTTSSHKGSTPLTQAKLPAKMVLALGQESDGLSESALKQGDMSVSIDGTGKVESLNVSVATGILLAEWWRQNH